MNDKIQRIADTYGFMAQARQTMEECAELIQALNKYMRALGSGEPAMKDGKRIEPETARDNVVEEIADVTITLEQLKYLMECEAEVSSIRKLKIKRTLKRIDGSGFGGCR